MKKALGFLLVLALATAASAQTISPGGGGGTPGGSSGQLQINNSGAFGGITLGGDCTFSSPNVTCTKTNGTSLGPYSTATQGQLPGIATNTAASAGNIGEIVSSTVLSGSAVSLSTGAAADITTIALTAGEWDITCNITNVTGSGTTATQQIASISATLNTLDLTPGNANINGISVTALNNTNLVAGPVRVSLSGPTTYHLVARMTFSGGTASAYGIIRATRVH